VCEEDEDDDVTAAAAGDTVCVDAVITGLHYPVITGYQMSQLQWV